MAPASYVFHISIFLSVFFLPTLQQSYRISDLRLCVDPNCTGVISYARTLLKYVSNDPGILSFGANSDVKIFSKSAGTQPDLWGGEINGRRGYFPKTFVREYKVVERAPLSIVPTEIFQVGESHKHNPNAGNSSTKGNIDRPGENPSKETEEKPETTEIHSTRRRLMSLDDQDDLQVPVKPEEPTAAKSFVVVDGTQVEADDDLEEAVEATKAPGPPAPVESKQYAEDIPLTDRKVVNFMAPTTSISQTSEETLSISPTSTADSVIGETTEVEYGADLAQKEKVAGESEDKWFAEDVKEFFDGFFPGDNSTLDDGDGQEGEEEGDGRGQYNETVDGYIDKEVVKQNLVVDGDKKIVDQQVEKLVGQQQEKVNQEVDKSVDQKTQNIVDQQVEKSVDQVEKSVGQQVEIVVNQQVEIVVNQQVDKVVDQQVEKVINQQVEKSVNQQVEKSVGQQVEKVVNQQVDKVVDQQVEKVVEQQVETLIDQQVAKLVDQQVDKVVDQQVEKSVDQQVEKSVDQQQGKLVDQQKGKLVDQQEGKIERNEKEVDGHVEKLVQGNELAVDQQKEKLVEQQHEQIVDNVVEQNEKTVDGNTQKIVEQQNEKTVDRDKMLGYGHKGETLDRHEDHSIENGRTVDGHKGTVIDEHPNKLVNGHTVKKTYADYYKKAFGGHQKPAQVDDQTDDAETPDDPDEDEEDEDEDETTPEDTESTDTDVTQPGVYETTTETTEQDGYCVDCDITVTESSDNVEIPRNEESWEFKESAKPYVDIIGTYTQMIIDLVPEPIFTALMDLQKRAVSPRVVVFTFLVGLFTFLVGLTYFTLHYKIKGSGTVLAAKLSSLDRKLFVTVTEKNCLNENLVTSAKRVEILEEELRSANDSVRILRDDLQVYKTENLRLQQTLETAEAELNLHRNAVLDLNAGAEDVNRQNLELRENLARMDVEMIQLQEQNSNLLADAMSSEMTKESLSLQLATQSEELEQLRTGNSQLLKEAEDWSATIRFLEQRVTVLTDEKQNLTDTLSAKDATLQVLQEMFKQMETGEEDGGENLLKVLDVANLKAELKSVAAERGTLQSKLRFEATLKEQLEGQLFAGESELERARKECTAAVKAKEDAEKRLQVLSNYFKEKEMELQKELGLQEAKRQQTHETALNIHQKAELYEQEVSLYKSQIESLKKEIADQERSFKMQIAGHEKKAHDNWLAARNAERRLEETKRESSLLRNKLTSLDQEKDSLTRSNPDGTLQPTSNRFIGSNGEMLASPPPGIPSDLPPSSGPSSLYHEPIDPRRIPLPFLPPDRPLPPPHFLMGHMPPPPPPMHPFLDRGPMPMYPGPPHLFDRGMPSPPPEYRGYGPPPPLYPAPRRRTPPRSPSPFDSRDRGREPAMPLPSRQWPQPLDARRDPQVPSSRQDAGIDPRTSSPLTSEVGKPHGRNTAV